MRTKHTLLVLFTLACSWNSFSQTDASREKIKALKVAFITEQLNLSEQEAVKFWPVYNKFEKKRHDLYYIQRRNLKKDIDQLGGIDKVDEKEAKTITDKMLALDKAEYDTQTNYFKEMRMVISNIKIIKLQNAERDFNRKLLTRFKRQRNPDDQ
jgi:hypothetical protein|uniref:sensor of ECF-type sigma factor n=1 Tax=Polaribacter sp. TaxID=1920175 RepID=UPI00404846F1